MTVVATPTEKLDLLALDISAAWMLTRTHQIDAWQGYLAVGTLLMEAREEFKANQDYGNWFKAQGFGFSLQWAGRLTKLAEHRPAVEAALQSALSDGIDKPPGVDALLALVNPPTPQPGGSRSFDVDRPEPVYAPDHLRSAVVEIIVTYPFGTTKREEGSGHGSGAERKEWHAEIVMQNDIPDSLLTLEPFASEMVRRFAQEVRERPFKTMLAR